MVLSGLNNLWALMFGFLKRQMRREHFKLVVMNSYAAEYLAAFPDLIDGEAIVLQAKAVRAGWQPGLTLSDEDAEAALKLNRLLRRAWDRLPQMLKRKPFDDQFAPLGGWKTAFQRYEL